MWEIDFQSHVIFKILQDDSVFKPSTHLTLIWMISNDVSFQSFVTTFRIKRDNSTFIIIAKHQCPAEVKYTISKFYFFLRNHAFYHWKIRVPLSSSTSFFHSAFHSKELHLVDIKLSIVNVYYYNGMCYIYQPITEDINFRNYFPDFKILSFVIILQNFIKNNLKSTMSFSLTLHDSHLSLCVIFSWRIIASSHTVTFHPYTIVHKLRRTSRII